MGRQRRLPMSSDSVLGHFSITKKLTKVVGWFMFIIRPYNQLPIGGEYTQELSVSCRRQRGRGAKKVRPTIMKLEKVQ